MKLSEAMLGKIVATVIIVGCLAAIVFVQDEDIRKGLFGFLGTVFGGAFIQRPGDVKLEP